MALKWWKTFISLMFNSSVVILMIRHLWEQKAKSTPQKTPLNQTSGSDLQQEQLFYMLQLHQVAFLKRIQSIIITALSCFLRSLMLQLASFPNFAYPSFNTNKLNGYFFKKKEKEKKSWIWIGSEKAINCNCKWIYCFVILNKKNPHCSSV